jgi:hypothetical protein
LATLRNGVQFHLWRVATFTAASEQSNLVQRIHQRLLCCGYGRQLLSELFILFGYFHYRKEQGKFRKSTGAAVIKFLVILAAAT